MLVDNDGGRENASKYSSKTSLPHQHATHLTVYKWFNSNTSRVPTGNHFHSHHCLQMEVMFPSLLSHCSAKLHIYIILPVVLGKLFQIRAVCRVAHQKKDCGLRELKRAWARAWMNLYLLHPGIFSICSSGSTFCLYPFWSVTLEADFMVPFSDFLLCSIKWKHWGDQRAGRNWIWSIYNYCLPSCCSSDW